MLRYGHVGRSTVGLLSSLLTCRRLNGTTVTGAAASRRRKTLPAPITILSWSIDRTETTSFAPARKLPKPTDIFAPVPMDDTRSVREQIDEFKEIIGKIEAEDAEVRALMASGVTERPQPVEGEPAGGFAADQDSNPPLNALASIKAIHKEWKGRKKLEPFWKVVEPPPFASDSPNYRPRRIDRETRLVHVCQTLSKVGADVVCLQDCDDEAVAAIEALRFALPPTTVSERPSNDDHRDEVSVSHQQWRYQLISKCAAGTSGLVASFVKVPAVDGNTAPSAGEDGQQHHWKLDYHEPMMPFVTFNISHTSSSSSSATKGTSNAAVAAVRHRPITISNVDLTHIVRDLTTDGYTAAPAKDDHMTLTQRFTHTLRGAAKAHKALRMRRRLLRRQKQKLGRGGKHGNDSAGKASQGNKKGGDRDDVDNFTLQRESTLQFLARGGIRLVDSKDIPMDEGELPPEEEVPMVPHIIVGNTHVRHGWSFDRMPSVLPEYRDAWFVAGKPQSDWESYAFYAPRKVKGGSTSSGSGGGDDKGAQQQQPTNYRYFADERLPLLGPADEDANTDLSQSSREKGGRYEKCLIHKQLLGEPIGETEEDAAKAFEVPSDIVSLSVPRPMIEENCSCADQFPIVVTIY